MRLIERTTRRVAPTAEGERYVAAARRILADIDAMEADVAESRGTPRGRLRVSSSVSFAVHQLAPVLLAFRDAYPGIDLDLQVTDRVVDILAENIDIGIRTGDVGDDRLVGRPFAQIRRVVCATPAYLARHGAPAHPAELATRACINISSARHLAIWPFLVDGRRIEIDTFGPVTVDNANGVLALGLAGLGIIRLGDFIVADDVRDGRLVPLFEDMNAAPETPIQLVHPPGRQRLPRVRAFLDFVTRTFRDEPWRLPKLSAPAQ